MGAEDKAPRCSLHQLDRSGMGGLNGYDFFDEPEKYVDALRSLLTENFQIIENALPNFES